MIEKALENLEKEKEIAIKKIQLLENISLDEFLKEDGSDFLIGKPIDEEKLREVAIKEVKINYIDIKRYLDQLKSENLDISDNLEAIEETYNKEEHYRFLMNYIGYHFSEIKDIPVILAEKRYCPSWTKTHVKVFSEVVK